MVNIINKIKIIELVKNNGKECMMITMVLIIVVVVIIN